MAEEKVISYNVVVNRTNTELYGGATFRATITRNKIPPVGAYPVRVDIKFTNLNVYSSKSPYIQFGDLFRTAGQSQSQGFNSAEVYDWPDNILDITSTTVTCTIKNIPTSNNGMNFKETSNGTSPVTLNVYYEINHSGSTSTLSTNNLYAEDTMSVSFENANASTVYHRVTWSFGSYSQTNQTGIDVRTTSYKIPSLWLNAIPSSTSGQGTVKVDTYASDGTFVGSTSHSFTLNVPESVVPTVESITAARIDNSVPPSWNAYVQNISGVTLTANGANGAHGSTIVSYKFTGSATATQTTNVFTINPITVGGSPTFSVQVTDSRGRTSTTVSCTISVMEYTPPTFASAVAFRCTSSGISDTEGTYVGVRTGADYSGQDGKNSLTVSCEYQRVGDETWTTGQNPMTLGTTYVIGDGDIGINYSYQVKFTIQDSFRTVERIVDVSTTQYTIFFKKGGTGVGIGKACEHEYALELNKDWGFFHGGVDLIAKINQAPNIVYSETEPTNATAGMIWLKPKS